MKLFLDTSVLLAAAGSTSGASRHLLAEAGSCGWQVVSSPYCLAEVERNVMKVGDVATAFWRERIKPVLALVSDSVVLDKPLLFPKVKDRPVLITALAARCDVLLTLDRVDFGAYSERGVYGLCVMTPGTFLRNMNGTPAPRNPTPS